MLVIENLSKLYENKTAIDNISFKIKTGDIVGFLGPNGAGKTTTMNIVTGYLSATSGSVHINNIDILDRPEEAKMQIGYLPDSPPLYPDLTTREYLKFVCELKKVPKTIHNKMIEDIIIKISLQDIENRLLKNLSKGFKQRVGLAQALVGFPKLIILDEPMIGLDPKQIIEMRDLIKRLGKEHTIILSSHILSEISAICDQVIIINKGKIVASDTPENLSESLNKGNDLLIRIKGNKENIEKLFENSNYIKNFEFKGVIEKATTDYVVSGIENDDIREKLFYDLSKNNLALLMSKYIDFSLEEIFLEITNEKEVQPSDRNI